jgi:TRAP-type C4-dicarboxylate transport system permease small subunit
LISFFKEIDASLRYCCKAASYLAGMVLVILLALAFIDIVGTQLFGKALPSAIELQEAFAAILIFCGFVAVQHERAHIAVDLAQEYLGTTANRVLEVFAQLCTLAVFMLLSYQSYALAMRSVVNMEDSPGFLSFPIYPFKIIACAACMLATAETLRQIINYSLGIEEQSKASFSKEELMP